MRFLCETRFGFIPINKIHIIPVIYKRGKGPTVKGEWK
jgi:hypothetical protein